MSHIVEIQIEVKDLEALKTAVGKLGLEWREGQQNFRWYGRFMNDSQVPQGFSPNEYGKCLHAIAVPGNSQAYEVGVVRNPNGRGWSLLWDAWSGGFGLQDRIGEGACRLKQRYDAEVATKSMWEEGFMVSEEMEPDGRIRLVCQR